MGFLKKLLRLNKAVNAAEVAEKIIEAVEAAKKDIKNAQIYLLLRDEQGHFISETLIAKL